MEGATLDYRYTDSDGYDLYILHVNGERVGEVMFNDEEDGEAVSLWSLKVYAGYRGKGYGKLIMKLAEAKAGGKPMILAVETDNHVAISLYRSVGFCLQKTHRGVMWFRKEGKAVEASEAA